MGDVDAGSRVIYFPSPCMILLYLSMIAYTLSLVAVDLLLTCRECRDRVMSVPWDNVRPTADTIHLMKCGRFC